MKQLGNGIISRVNKNHMWIRLHGGGEVLGPRLSGFKRGDKIQFLTNGQNTQIIGVYHRHKIHIPKLNLLHTITPEDQELECKADGLPDWFESWVPLYVVEAVV